MKVVIEDGRVVRLLGDKTDPVTRGFLCERTSKFTYRQYAPDRFTSPMRRTGDRLAPIGWDEALDLAAEKLLEARRRLGPASVLNYRSGGSLGILKHVVDLVFARFGPVTTKRGDICSGAGDAAQEVDFGINESHDLFDLVHSQLIVLWGKNPHTSNVHLLPVLEEARAKGAILIGIDPVRTRAARMCDRFLMPRPGTDFEIAMAIASVLFEQGAVDPEASRYCDHLDAFRSLAFERSLEERAAIADVPPADLYGVAELFASTKPASIQVGWGMGRRRNGSMTIRAVDALGAVSGNMGVRGGGVSYYFGRRRAFDTDFGFEVPKPPRTFAEALLGKEILDAKDPPIEVAWVTAGNPVTMLPESDTVRRALESIPFLVVVDTHPTDTTDVADLVLPTLTLLEDSDLLGAYGNHWLRVSRSAIAPPPGPRHEIEILMDLAKRIGVDLAGSVDEWKQRAMARLEASGVTLDRLARGAVRNPFAKPILFEGRTFPTPSTKVRLIDRPASPPPPVDAEYPLTLLPISTPKAQSSQASGPVPKGAPDVFLHPDAAPGFSDGDSAILVSRIAELRVVLRFDAASRKDVARMDKGGMLRDGRCANRLIRAVETDFGGGAAYYDEPVRIRSDR
jgi:anaerobic selenocysteine-containing dehydrogenase